MSDKEITRAEFEAFCIASYPTGQDFSKDSAGNYTNGWMMGAFFIWQAAKEQYAPRENERPIAISLLNARETKKLGIRGCAKEIGISPTTLSKVERGHTPDIKSLAKICDWLNAPLESSAKALAAQCQSAIRAAELEQALASLVWAVEHNTGREPSISCYERAIDEAKALIGDKE